MLTTNWVNMLYDPLQNGFMVFDKRFSCAPTISRGPVIKLINNKSSSRPIVRHIENIAANNELSPLPSTYKNPLPWIRALNDKEMSATVLPLPVEPNIKTCVRISSLLNQSSSLLARRLPKKVIPRAFLGLVEPGNGSL